MIDFMQLAIEEALNSDGDIPVGAVIVHNNEVLASACNRKEKDNVFGEGSRAPVAIVFLVKNPDKSEHGKIYFHAVDDYLTREEKLDALKKDRSISYTPMNVIVPDDHGDWR